MSNPIPPPSIFEFAPDVPEGVEVYADPTCVKITVAPLNVSRRRLALIMDSVAYVAFFCCWAGALMFLTFLSRPFLHKLIAIFLVETPILALWLLILKKQLKTPTIFSIRDTKSFRISGPGYASTWPLYEHSRLRVERNKIYCSAGRRGSSYLKGYPPETREWVVREFKRAGQWAYDWLTYRVTVAAAAVRAETPRQDVIPLPQPVATPKPEPTPRITSFGVGPRILDYPIPPPRGSLRYETIPNGVAIVAPPEGLWGCGIILRLILALLYASLILWFRNPLVQIALAALAIPVAFSSILRMRWRAKQPAILAVLPGEFALDDVRWNQRQRKTVAYDKVRALTAYLYRPDYNYVAIHTIEGDLCFGHRCNEDEIRWLGNFILARVGIPQEQMKINRGERPEKAGNTGLFN